MPSRSAQHTVHDCGERSTGLAVNKGGDTCNVQLPHELAASCYARFGVGLLFFLQVLLGYLKLLLNPGDDAALLAVLNQPPRGLGACMQCQHANRALWWLDSCRSSAWNTGCLPCLRFLLLPGHLKWLLAWVGLSPAGIVAEQTLRQVQDTSRMQPGRVVPSLAECAARLGCGVLPIKNTIAAAPWSRTGGHLLCCRGFAC